MGGFGSGRQWYSTSTKVENCRSIDVNWLHRRGCLKAGWSGSLFWGQDLASDPSIRIRAEVDRIVLKYSYRRNGDEWRPIEEPVYLRRVPCRFGGTRPYFICPGVVGGRTCGRRVSKLLAGGPYFLCRHCYRLSYSSQSEDRLGRLYRKRNKLARRLGDDPENYSFSFRRPKGMWHRTFKRLLEEFYDVESAADDEFVVRAAGLLRLR